MKISDILSLDNVFLNIDCNSKKAAIELLAKNLADFIAQSFTFGKR